LVALAPTHPRRVPLILAMTGIDRETDDVMEDVFLQEHLSRTIAQHAEDCSLLFHKLIVRPEIVPDPTIMDDQLARFKLWASNMDVYGPPNVSLDYRLRYSPTVVEIIHQLLDIILDTLSSCKWCPHGMEYAKVTSMYSPC
jgi:hypothetical protein